MTTREYIFNFPLDAQGWLANPSDVLVDQSWLRLRPGSSKSRAAPILSLLGGVLRSTAKRGAPASSNFWKWLDSLDTLFPAAPPTANILSIKADYQCRVVLGKNSRYPLHMSQTEFTGAEVASGPFEVLDEFDSPIDVFSGQEFAPERNAITTTLYSAWPVGTDNHDIIVPTPTSWHSVPGGSVDLTGLGFTYLTPIQLRLWSYFPAIPNTGSVSPDYIQMKQDRIVITVVDDSVGTPANLFPFY